jgi:uncharacterized iron-regulated membrane protein
MRSVLRQVHRWLGIALAICVIAIGLSDAILIFRPELQKVHPPIHSSFASGAMTAPTHPSNEE